MDAYGAKLERQLAKRKEAVKAHEPVRGKEFWYCDVSITSEGQTIVKAFLGSPISGTITPVPDNHRTLHQIPFTAARNAAREAITSAMLALTTPKT